MLASDAVEAKIKLPCIAQPKIDGVRSLNMTGLLTGRSLKTHANRHITRFFSVPELAGFDGEMAAEHECHPDLCRLTTSALNTISGEPWILWHLFDYVTSETEDLAYIRRYDALLRRIETLHRMGHPFAAHLRAIPSVWCDTKSQLDILESNWLDMGYEGVILRDPDGLHKDGRSTVREGGLLRIKRFIDGEAVVTSITEGRKNLNAATINELGLTERSTHQENMEPNGMVGSMECRVLKDVLYDGKVFFHEGQIITVGAGRMTHNERVRYFEDQTLLIGAPIKFKTFPKGVKDKPRFPTFQTIRTASDL